MEAHASPLTKEVTMTFEPKCAPIKNMALVCFAAASLVMISSNSLANDDVADLSEFSNERFQLKRDGDAFIRLDKQTGAMSICDRKGSRLICRLAADERTALQDEIASLQDRLDKLESRLDDDDVAQLPKKNVEPDKRSRPKDDSGSDAYFEEELDKVVDYSTKVLKRFFTVMKELREDFEK